MFRLMELESDVEANFIKGLLADHDIQAIVTGLDGSALGAALDGPDVIEVFVKSADLEKAQELVDALEEEENEAVPAWTCECGEEVDEGFYICWSCGAEYKPSD